MSTHGSDNRHHFETSHLQGDLVGRSVRGSAVTLVAQGLKVIIQFAAIVVLARLLAPRDFGLFAMVAAFLIILELLKDLGLSTATIQRPDLTHRQVSTLFWLNCALGIVAAALTAACAPLFAWLYGEPQLVEITLAVAGAFVFTGLSAQHFALMRRQMRFGAAAGVQLASEVVGLVAAVVAAIAGLGFWSLVIQRIGWAVTMAVGAWALCHWRPGRPGPFSEVRSLVVFGANATGAMTIAGLAGNMDKVIIGWYWGSTPLGLFERAQKLLLQPIQNINMPLATVALPALSRLAANPPAYRDTYIAIVFRLTMLMAPIAAVMIAAAEPTVMLVFGTQWLDAAPVLAWMAVGVVFMPVTYSLSWLYMSQDRTREMLHAGIANSVLAVLGVVAGVPFGIVGVAISLTLSLIVVRGPVLFWLAARRGPVPLTDLYRILATPSLATALGAGAVWAVRVSEVAESWTPATVVAISVVIACAAAMAVYLVAPGSRRAIASLSRLPGHLTGRAVRA